MKWIGIWFLLFLGFLWLWGSPAFVKDTCLSNGYPDNETTGLFQGYCIKGEEIIDVWKVEKIN